MKTKIYIMMNNFIYVVFAILGIIVLAINYFSDTDYTCKTTFLFPNLVLFLVGILTFIVLRLTWGKIVDYHKKFNINRATIILFLFQSYIFANIYFISQQWDAWVVVKYAQVIKENLVDAGADHYFSVYSCNQLLVAIYAFIFKLNDIMGVLDTENGLLFIILIQCALSACTGKLLFHIIFDYTKSPKYAWLGWSVYVILIGLSGWNVVTYTDMMGLIFPTAIFRIYQLLENDRYVYLKWFGIVTLSFWGYKMKATVIIIVIAIGIVEILKCIKNINIAKIKRAAIILVISSLCILIYAGTFSYIMLQTGLRIEPEFDVGPLHVVMIGLNPEKDGAWYGPDEELSKSIRVKADRREAQLEVIRQRLETYGITGFLEHMWKKSLVIFNDGTFAWGHEGGFFDVIYDDKNEVVAPFLKSIYYTYGSRYGVSSTICQMFWITVLTCSFGLCFFWREDNFSTTIVLSLIGIILFTYLTEARARYIILYVPFFIIAATITLFRLSERRQMLNR